MARPTFAKQICIVTGGASGLGRELCVQLAAAGATVILSDVDGARATEAAATMTGAVTAVPCDVTDAAAVQALIDGAVADFGRIDYLFNNAGVAVMGEIRDLSLAQWRRVIETNLFGVIHGVHHAYPHMIRQGHGHIVNIASGFGMAPGPLYTPYVASKFGVYGISHALATEAAAFGIHVSLVCPGFIQTPLVADAQPINADAKAVLAMIPVKIISVERAAQLTLAGVARRRAIIAFPRYVWILTALHRRFPRLFNRIGRKQLADFRRLRPTAP